MDPRIRYSPIVALVALVVIRVFKHDFLSQSLFHHSLVSWISWFGVLFTILAWWSAYLLAPAFVHVVNASARYYALPPIIVFSIIIALLWGADMIWNATVPHWCPSCPHNPMLGSLSTAISGK